MANATINLVSPSGVPIALEIGSDDKTEVIMAVLERAEKIGEYYAQRGWGFAETGVTVPSAAEVATGPTFCGYPCSPTADDKGLPSWILVDGRQAHRHEKQGDTWWSVKVDAGQYAQVLRIPKGEKAPKIVGL